MEDIKITYATLDGGTSKAYVTIDSDDEFAIGVGINKHTDESVKVVWTGLEWIEIEDEA